MIDTYYIRLVASPSQSRLSQLVDMDSVKILCTSEGQELLRGCEDHHHGPIHFEDFLGFKRILCEESIYHIFHGHDLKQFAENYFFIDPKKFDAAINLLPKAVSLLDISACTIL